MVELVERMLDLHKQLPKAEVITRAEVARARSQRSTLGSPAHGLRRACVRGKRAGSEWRLGRGGR
jgi:hypothetical protein